MKYKKIKKMLKKNEIFFTTISSLLLSLMAIIVSIMSFVISEKQYQMDYFEKSPDFQIQVDSKRDLETKYFYQNTLIINKLSGKAKNINIDIISFFDLKLTFKNNMQKKIRFNLLHYYDTNFIGKNGDTIQQSTGYLNNFRYVNFEKAIYKELQKTFQFIEPELKTYVQISYLNFLNERKTEYYYIEFGTGNITNDYSIEKYFNRNDESFATIQDIKLDDLKNMDVPSIVTLIKQSISNQKAI